MAKDEQATLRKGSLVELNRKYFSSHNGMDAPFTQGVPYRIMKVYRSWPFVDKHLRSARQKEDPTRKGVMLTDDKGNERTIDRSYLASPGYWEEHKDDPKEPILEPMPREPFSEALKHPEHIPPDDQEPGVWNDLPDDRDVSFTGSIPLEELPKKIPKRYSPFSTTLTEEMERKDISVRKFAMRMGVTETYAKMLETKSNTPRIDTAYRAGIALGLEGKELDEFLAKSGHEIDRNTLEGFLKWCRLLSGKKQIDVADDACISPGYLSALERGTGDPPSEAVVSLLADAYNLERKMRAELYKRAGFTLLK